MSPDRRRCPRAHVALVASVFRGERCVGHYLVRNLSVGGALLISGPTLPAHTAYRLVLRGPGARGLVVRAETLRATPMSGETGLAVVFEGLTADLRGQLDELVGRALTADRPGVLVADPDPTVLAALAEDLDVLGRRALLALTPLEAVRWLCDADRLEAALVSYELRRGSGVDLLAFIAEEAPSVHRVLMYRDLPASELLAGAEESRARGTLRVPWDGVALAAVLRHELRRPSLPSKITRAS